MPEDVSFADIVSDVADTDPKPGLDPAAVFDDAAGSAIGVVVEHAGHEPRFEGDTSALPPEVSWTLQELVAAPHITDKAKKHWAVLLQYEELLRSRLSELGLLLELNREHGYAFTRQADDPSPHSRTILRTRTLSLAASALALYLYQQFLTAPDDPVVSTADMLDHMLAYKRADDTDEAAFQKKIITAIKLLDDVSIIKPIKGTDRYLIYGVITSILTADRVEELGRKYQAIARGEFDGAFGEDDADE